MVGLLLWLKVSWINVLFDRLPCVANKLVVWIAATVSGAARTGVRVRVSCSVTKLLKVPFRTRVG